MRAFVYVAAMTLLLAVATPAVAQKKETSPKYDVSTETTIKGTVEELKEVDNNKGDIHLIVKTSSGNYEVCMCPQKFLDEMELQIKKGDEVNVIGSKVKDGEKELVLAREITSGNNSLTLRDKKGAPVWTFLVK